VTAFFVPFFPKNPIFATMRKQTYITPESELLVVRFEENILSDTYTQGGGGTYSDEDGTINDNGGY